MRSRKAGERVMALLRRLYEGLHLSVNESKSAVTSAFGRKFLGYAFWGSSEGVKRRVATRARKQFKQRIRQLTRRSGGRSLQQTVDRLRPYLMGWKTYFGWQGSGL
ncbi:Group II intron, maturase-specific domain [compost metagenome]